MPHRNYGSATPVVYQEDTNYEVEQHTLERQVAELESIMTVEKESALGVYHFLALLEYADIQESQRGLFESSIKKSMYTGQSQLVADEYSVSKSLIHQFLHPPQNKKNRHSG